MKKLFIYFSLLLSISCNAQSTLPTYPAAGVVRGTDLLGIYQPWNTGFGLGSLNHTYKWTADNATDYFKRRLLIWDLPTVGTFSTYMVVDSTHSAFGVFSNYNGVAGSRNIVSTWPANGFGAIAFGDFDGRNKRTKFDMRDYNQITQMGTAYNGIAYSQNFRSEYLADGSVGQTEIGDISATGNGLTFKVDDANFTYTLNGFAGIGAHLLGFDIAGGLTDIDPATIAAPIPAAGAIVYGDGSTPGGVTNAAHFLYGYNSQLLIDISNGGLANNEIHIVPGFSGINCNNSDSGSVLSLRPWQTIIGTKRGTLGDSCQIFLDGRAHTTTITDLKGTGNRMVVASAAGVITATATLPPVITSGTTAPASTPGKVGDMYIDTTGKKLYFATGTSSSADWTIAN